MWSINDFVHDGLYDGVFEASWHFNQHVSLEEIVEHLELLPVVQGWGWQLFELFLRKLDQGLLLLECLPVKLVETDLEEFSPELLLQFCKFSRPFFFVVVESKDTWNYLTGILEPVVQSETSCLDVPVSDPRGCELSLLLELAQVVELFLEVDLLLVEHLCSR